MGAPTLDVTVQPTDGGKAYYLPIAAKKQGDPDYVKIVLRLDIHNPTDKDVKVTAITFSYPGSNVATSEMFREVSAMRIVGAEDPPVIIEGTPVATLAAGVIPHGETAVWSNGVVDDHRNEVYLEAPAPPRIQVNITCDKFTSPKTVPLDLAPYVDPTGSGSLKMPFSNIDLDDGEYLVTSAKHWANGGAGGTQIFAHDIEVQKKVGGDWTRYNKTGVDSDNDKNEDHRIFGKPVRAVADGEVASFENDILDNAEPGIKASDANFIKIRHGDITVSYLHFQKGSIPPALMEKNSAGDPIAVVTAGQIIGIAGNSGRSDYPHLHIQGVDTATRTLRGLPFKAASVLDRDEIAQNGTGPWVTLTADGICKDKVAIRPGWNFGPVGGLTDVEIAEIVADVMGGVSKGGDGFVIVNGKFKRVPPRGIKADLLKALTALHDAEGNAKKIAETRKEIARIGKVMADGR